MGLIFIKASVADLESAEQSLGDMEDVLHLASDTGFLILYGTVQIKAGCLGLPMKPVVGIRTVFLIRLEQKRHNIPFARIG